MPEDVIVQTCSPTLAGIKTGSIFNISYESAAEMRIAVRRWNSLLGKKGLRFIPLRYGGGRALIYAYRPSSLSRDLCREEACRILRDRGYCTDSCERCVAQLIKRLREGGEFPHEIGLFLGYPPEDVCGFIDNKACGYKCIGCWKVYGDEKAAARTFAKYKKCTEVYCAQFKGGRPLEKLTVSL